MQPALSLPAVEYAERSDPGRDPDKQVNEDACGHRETRFGHLCIVCDGMGGHAAGREAAELAVATVCEVFDRAADGTPAGALLKEAIEEASRRIHVMQTSEVALGRPGSTAVAVLMHAHGTEVAHVGDSRAYLVHEGQIFRMTRDHSVVQELVDRGLLTPAQAAHHPDSNRITRALGMAAEVEADLRPQPVHHVTGDTFVLCSDGLSDLVEDHEILTIVGAEPPAQAAGQLVDLANARGGHDNVTVLVLRARETVFSTITSVAPTVAQTAITQAPATVPLPPAATFVEPRAPQGTEPGVPQPALPRGPELPPAPPSSRARPRQAPAPAVLVAGVLLAAAAFALLVAVLLAHVADRSGKRSVSPALPLSVPDGQAAQPLPLVPEGVAVPTAGAPADPIAPLAPSPSSTARKRR